MSSAEDRVEDLLNRDVVRIASERVGSIEIFLRTDTETVSAVVMATEEVADTVRISLGWDICRPVVVRMSGEDITVGTFEVCLVHMAERSTVPLLVQEHGVEPGARLEVTPAVAELKLDMGKCENSRGAWPGIYWDVVSTHVVLHIAQCGLGSRRHMLFCSRGYRGTRDQPAHRVATLYACGWV